MMRIVDSHTPFTRVYGSGQSRLPSEVNFEVQ
jgi:hypothetical protein